MEWAEQCIIFMNHIRIEIMDKTILFTQLTGNLINNGYISYDRDYKPQELFWEFWKRHNEPEVIIEYDYFPTVEFIPINAKIRISSSNAGTQDFLNSLRHTENVICDDVYDEDIAGYTGNVVINTITLTDLALGEKLPNCSEYEPLPEAHLEGRFDCKGKVLHLPHIVNSTGGVIKKIAECFFNFSELAILPHQLKLLVEEAPELITIPGVNLRLDTLDRTFDTKILAGIHIPRLVLHGDNGTAVKHDPDTVLNIGDIVRYHPCFEEFVQSTRRFKRTKRCTS